MFASLLGTPLYMAPEIHKREKYNSKSDLWSVGVILYEMCYGQSPFKARTQQELQVELSKPIELKALVGWKGQHCVDLLTRLLVADSKHRLSWDQFFAHPFLHAAHQLRVFDLAALVSRVIPIASIERTRVEDVLQHGELLLGETERGAQVMEGALSHYAAWLDRECFIVPSSAQMNLLEWDALTVSLLPAHRPNDNIEHKLKRLEIISRHSTALLRHASQALTSIPSIVKALDLLRASVRFDSNALVATCVQLEKQGRDVNALAVQLKSLSLVELPLPKREIDALSLRVKEASAALNRLYFFNTQAAKGLRNAASVSVCVYV